ncbi:DUF4097 family beta strand repeat-containing protein [Dictyobacter aurantiacus]|uniref:DUF4097 domain-containing protein n=1 Tax=Dictyobacter aurantiacus TaxID=1936993 RepID=A0A401ZJM9_9CHLR|nr:DUF4097 family beta strand repeat-containing protein [Dictyobacter aurantiacus]GCE07049.1 hypothetical protein KDAU_43780 [Dictyobacter aurantiacus]
MSQQQSQFDEKGPQEPAYAPRQYFEGQVPLEVNQDPREQAAGPREYSYAPIGDAYTASYGQGEKLTPRPPRRRHRGRNWLIGIVIVLALIWGAGASMRSNVSFPTTGWHHVSIDMHKDGAYQPGTTSSTYSGSQLVLRGVRGNVHIQGGGNSDQVQVNTSNNINLKGSSDNGVITLQEAGMPGRPDPGIGDDGGDINVTVPKGMQVTVDMAMGPVDVDGVTGKLNIQAADGEISINNTTLQDGSKLQTLNGSIRFNGSLDPKGSYDFETANGDVSVRLPQDNVANVATNTVHGDINNHLNSGGNDPNAANVTIKTISGNIDVNNQ